MAINRTIYVRATEARVRQILSQLPAHATGQLGTSGGLAKTLLVRLGLAALGQIKQAFVVKARGGTDAAGDRWKPLSPYTIAYKRRHFIIGRSGQPTTKRLPRSKARAPYRPSWILTKKQRDRWWALYKRFLATYKGDKAHAAASAWVTIKNEGARTIMGVYGNQPVEILRDTGLLLNSLSPGIPADAARQFPPKVNKQVFKLEKGAVIVGTNRKWCWTHHYGVPGRIPQRRLWPEPARWPTSFWDNILEQGQKGVVEILRYLLSGGRP